MKWGFESEPKDDGFLIPAGSYGCIVTEAQDCLDASTPNVEIELEIVKDPSGQFAGRKFRDWFYASEKAKWRFFRFLKVVGMPVEENSEVDIDPAQLRGKPVTVALKVEKQTKGKRAGQMVNRVDYAGYSRDEPTGPESDSQAGQPATAGGAPDDGDVPF